MRRGRKKLRRGRKNGGGEETKWRRGRKNGNVKKNKETGRGRKILQEKNKIEVGKKKWRRGRKMEKGKKRN